MLWRSVLTSEAYLFVNHQIWPRNWQMNARYLCIRSGLVKVPELAKDKIEEVINTKIFDR